MKANELMIGDWVSYYKPDTELVIGRIKKLNVNKYLDGDDEIVVNIQLGKRLVKQQSSIVLKIYKQMKKKFLQILLMWYINKAYKTFKIYKPTN